MNRYSSEKKKSDDLKGWGIIAFIVVLIILGGFFYCNEKNSRIERDPISLCRTDGLFPRETALLIDITEGFSESQALLIMRQMETVLDSSFVDERFTFYALNDDPDTFKPLFTVCNPGDGSGQSELTANVRRIYENWETNFYERITNTVESLIDETGAESSPIMEMFKFVGIQTMFNTPASQKRVVIVSDMIHNTLEYSQYSDPPRYDYLENTPYLTRVLANLNDADVEIFYIVRPRLVELQNRGHINLFWEQYISESGGRLIFVEPIN